MSVKYILYNPYSGDAEAQKRVDSLLSVHKEAALINLTRITSYEAFFNGLEGDADIILCGGDGTLNHFVNNTRGIEIKNKLYYYPVGTGNDFARDIGYEKYAEPNFCINSYLSTLPSVTVNGEERLFINNVGFGIDGYCCEVGDALKQQTEKKKAVNYTTIAIKGLLFHYKPKNATVTVDGKKQSFKKVWLAPCMNGRYYGGGMMPTPDQSRGNPDGTASVMVFHGLGKLGALIIFPSIFSGKHIKHKKHVAVLSGHSITVEYDESAALQIDGETILNVKSYSVLSSREAQKPTAKV